MVRKQTRRENLISLSNGRSSLQRKLSKHNPQLGSDTSETSSTLLSPPLRLPDQGLQYPWGRVDTLVGRSRIFLRAGRTKEQQQANNKTGETRVRAALVSWWLICSKESIGSTRENTKPTTHRRGGCMSAIQRLGRAECYLLKFRSE